MFVANRFSPAAILILTCLLSAGGQQRQTDQTKQIAVLNQRIDDLRSDLVQAIKFQDQEMDVVGKQIDALESNGGAAAGRYQITATTVDEEGVPFVEVFRADTQTGIVCQVVSSKVMKGELVGSSLPYCTQQ